MSQARRRVLLLPRRGRLFWESHTCGQSADRRECILRSIAGRSLGGRGPRGTVWPGGRTLRADEFRVR